MVDALPVLKLQAVVAGLADAHEVGQTLAAVVEGLVADARAVRPAFVGCIVAVDRRIGLEVRAGAVVDGWIEIDRNRQFAAEFADIIDIQHTALTHLEFESKVHCQNIWGAEVGVGEEHRIRRREQWIGFVIPIGNGRDVSCRPRPSAWTGDAEWNRKPSGRRVLGVLVEEWLALAHDIGVDGVEENAEPATKDYFAVAVHVVGEPDTRRDSVEVGGHQRIEYAMIADKGEASGCARKYGGLEARTEGFGISLGLEPLERQFVA